MSRNVRNSWAVAAGCLGVIGATSGVLGVTPDQDEAPGPANPYAVIIDRNVFRLNPPPPPPDPTADVKPLDLPQYKLTGIANISGKTRVFFALVSKDAKEPTTYLDLQPGERQGQLELVSIDRDKEEVAVINSGTSMTLSVKSNSFAASGAPAPAAPPGPGAGRRLPGFPAPPAPGVPPPLAPPPAAAPAAEASQGGGVVVIGGGGSGAESGGGGNGNYAQQNGGGNYAQGAGYSGGNYGNGFGGGVSVSGASPLNYGGVGGGNPGVTIATPNGALNLGASAPQGQTANWPPVQEANPVEQAAALLAASEGQGLQSSGKGNNNGKPMTGPPMPPVRAPGQQ